MATPQPPPLPDGVLLQLALVERGVVHRVALDGRYLVTDRDTPERQAPPRSRLERGRAVLSERALARLRTVLAEVDFFGRPAEVPGRLPPAPETVRLPGGGRLTPTAVWFTAREGDRVHSVLVRGDPRVADTLGALAPLYTALDEEALGGWMGE